MNRKTIVLFAVVSFFLSTFFVGCVSSSTSSAEGPPYRNIPNLDNYDAIFVGEDHNSRERYEVLLNLIKYYYTLGIRDFAFEQLGHGHVLLLQHYFDTGDEETLDFILRDIQDSTFSAQERPQFYRDIYAWNETLEQKIKVYNFDVGHSFEASTAAIYLYILSKYPLIEGIPGLSAPGSRQELINDFKNNKARYSSLKADDMKLLEKIVANLEQYTVWRSGNDREQANDDIKEQFMIDNFREILNDTGGRKIFAVMGWNHASLNGYADPPQTGNFSMASVLKEEIRIASIVLRQHPDPDRFQYIVRINENLTSEPYNSTYNGDWPFSEGNGYSSNSPYITQFVAGIRLYDSDNGLPEKTVFNVGDEFWYGFRARDLTGDWKRMVHTVTQGDNIFDLSWDFPNDYLGRQSVGANDAYRLGTSGTWEMTWYIIDSTGNKSNVITKTITVN